MAGKVRALFFCILLSIVSACAGRPVFTVEVLKTPTPTQWFMDSSDSTPTPGPATAIPPAQGFAPTLTPVQDLPAFMPPTPTPTAGVMPADFSPILYGKKIDADTFFILLGGLQGTTWLTPEQVTAQFAGAYLYDVYPFSQGSFQVYGYAPEFSYPSQEYFIGTDASYDAFGMVAVAHGWPVRQVVPQELSAETEMYQNVVSDWLEAQGMARQEPGVIRILRVDLEKDGVDEIFISATHLDDSQHYTKAGDYSIVLMRKVVGNDVLTLPVVADLYRSQGPEITYPRTYSLANFIDLDRDGILEVVVDFLRWEEVGALLYRVDGPDIIRVP